MQFQVPQFIETEDKIVGPLTLKQFLYLAGAGGVSFFFFFFIQTWLWMIMTVFLGVIGASLAFIKANGRPLPVMLRSALAYYWKPRLFLWQRKKGMAKETLPELGSEKKPKIPWGERLAVGAQLKGIFEKLQTSRAPVPKRENGSARTPALSAHPAPTGAVEPQKRKKERFESWRKITGAPEIAKRVDYR